MKKTILKKTLALCIAALLCVSVTACDEATTNIEPSSSTGETSSDNASTPAEDESEAPESSEDESSEEESKPAEAHEITYNKVATWTDSIGSVWEQTIIEITNTGSENLYLSAGAYDLEDESGALVASSTMASCFPDVIAPGEKGYMYEVTTLDEAPEGELVAIPRESVKKASVDLIRYETTDVKISETDFGDIKILGRVENTSEESSSMVYIAVVLYDADGNPVAVEFTILSEELAPGDKIGFEFQSFSLPNSVTADTIADYAIYAYPMQMQF